MFFFGESRTLSCLFAVFFAAGNLLGRLRAVFLHASEKVFEHLLWNITISYHEHFI